MPNEKLSQALAALKKVTKGEGVVSMNAEELTAYAEDQITKAAIDGDEGTARISALTTVIEDANAVFKTDPTAKIDFVPFADIEPDSNADLAKQLAEIKDLLSKQDNEVGNPTTTTVHPPPVPEGHDGGSVATNLPQGDDNGPRSEASKADEGASDAKPEGEAAAAEGDAKPEDEKADGFIWPLDMSTEAHEKAQNITKRDASAPAKPQNSWGLDTEAPPA